MKKKNKKEKDRSIKIKEVELPKSNLEVLPIRHYDEEASGYVLADDSYLDFYEIRSNDIDNSFVDEVQYDMLRLARFLKLYPNDIKIVGMNFPVSTQRQRKFLGKKLEETNSPIRKKWLRRSIEELAKQDLYTTKREYYLMFFAKDREEQLKNRQRISDLLGTGQNGLLSDVSKEKKHHIIFKMNNPNSLIQIKEVEVDDFE